MAVERRSYPRYPLTCDVRVVLPDDGGEFQAEATHLSRTSIQLSCQTGLFAALLKQQHLPYVCRLEFKLCWHKRLFNMEAHLLTHRRLSQQHYVLVLLCHHEADRDQELLLGSLLEQYATPGQ